MLATFKFYLCVTESARNDGAVVLLVLVWQFFFFSKLKTVVTEMLSCGAVPPASHSKPACWSSVYTLGCLISTHACKVFHLSDFFFHISLL